MGALTIFRLPDSMNHLSLINDLFPLSPVRSSPKVKVIIKIYGNHKKKGFDTE